MNKIVLISCVKRKLIHPAMARDLYQSQWFRWTLAYARRLQPQHIFVLSAKHGLVELDQQIEPYDTTLNSMSAPAVKGWAGRVLQQLSKLTNLDNDHFVVLASERYRKHLLPHLPSHEVPMQGLSIGRQLAFLKRQLDGQPSPPSATDGACGILHRVCWQLPRLRFPFDGASIPSNGIYVLFERGETGHGGDRIVRVGTHRGHGNLPKRLVEHFLKENKDRSIFRKNIGRALLRQMNDPFFEQWDLDLTTSAARQYHGHLLDRNKLAEMERAVTAYMRERFSFVVLDVPDKTDRLLLESRLIGTVASCPECCASPAWLGRFSSKPQIVASGLWLVQGLDGKPLSPEEARRIGRLAPPATLSSAESSNGATIPDIAPQ